MEADFGRLESFSSNEVISSLWNKNAAEKCRIGLADTVVYENGAPVRWYVTDKTGEVNKKRSAELGVISQRWMKIAEQTESPIISIVRQKGGILKFLSVEAWDNFIQDSADSTVDSLHLFINGDTNTIYRNSYKLRDRIGRFTTTTSSYVLDLSKTKVEPVTVLYEHKFDLVLTKATQIRKVLDLATNNVVRYMELMLNIKIVVLTVDYVVDKKSQIWLLWVPECQFVPGSDLQNAPIPNMPTGEGRQGRMSWAGAKYFEELAENQPDKPSSPPKSPSRLDGGASLTSTIESGSVDPSVVVTQVNSATSVNKNPKVKRKRVNDNSSAASYHATEISQNMKGVGSFPDPFKCRGVYCNVLLQPTGVLETKTTSQKHLSSKFFTKKEIEKLRKDRNFGQMMEFGSAGPGLAVISMRSILQANQERRGLSDGPEAPSWDKYPDSPRLLSASKEKADFESIGSTISSETREQKRQESILAYDKQQREHFTKSMSNYYEQVRVCGTCYGVYTCLDWARDILGTGDAYGAGLQGKGAGHSRSLESIGSRGGSRQHPRSVSSLENSTLDPTTGDLREGSIESYPDSTSAGKVAKDQDRPLPSYASATSASKSSQYQKKLPQLKSKPNSALKNRGASTSYISRENEGKSTWKKHLDDVNTETVKSKTMPAGEADKNFVRLDDYLRGGSKAVAARKERERENLAKVRVNNLVNPELDTISAHEDSTIKTPALYHGRVLLACEDNEHATSARDILEDAQFSVHWAQDGRQAINDLILNKGADAFDCVVVQKHLPLNNVFEMVKGVRKHEGNLRKEAAAVAAQQGLGRQPPAKRFPVICYTDETSPDELRAYMKADMDGCVSYPVNRDSLLSTLHAAIPHHLTEIPQVEPKVTMEMLNKKKNEPKVYRMGAMGELEGSKDSASMAANTLPYGKRLEDDIAFNGVVQIDADTRVPYMVLDGSRNNNLMANPSKPFFNLIVCHDLFDTAEKMKIFLRPMVQRYLGMQVLLWNYPGQAFTEWRAEQLLNNEYLATCLNEVLGQVGSKGTNDFDTNRPFYILGFGNGASISSFYAAHYRVPNLRGLLNINGWSFLDSYLAGIMHDCINIFKCSPPSRPDLPVYFFSRFLFSKAYLSKVSVPLALNIYTAVHNSISIEGRISLCKGVLQMVDLRPLLKEIDCPMICIHSTQDELARPLHAEPFVKQRAGEVRSIYKALQHPLMTCLVWLKGGHEVFQENKKQTQLLIEQILTGFFETHDISFPGAPAVDGSEGRMLSSLPWENTKTADKAVEDKFIDNVLGSVNRLQTATKRERTASSSKQSRRGSPDKISHETGTIAYTTGGEPSPPQKQNHGSAAFTATDPATWQKYSQVMSEKSYAGGTGGKGKENRNKTEKAPQLVVDPSSSLFELQDSQVYGAKAMETRKQQDVHDYVEVKEYMGWRLKRNRKRLQRLQGAARTIQGAFRAFIARRLVHNIRRLKATLTIQRVYRGWKGRCRFRQRVRNIWAAQVLQRAWRGYLGRKWYFVMRLRLASAVNIQRMFRGHIARVRVAKLKKDRYRAASIIQAMARRVQARKDAWRRRQFRNCATAIQRIYRGHLGRKRAAAERDKYIFSRSQSQGIEFGRQMLLEHKLHATRLQSDVTLLTQEKVASEEQIEALLEEISSFEEGVRTLEKEMHQLSKVESEAAAFMDEDSKFELREQKMKLDREFGEMLVKIGNRKEMLNDLERKLSTIDKSRQAKEEELRTLERKLVVLLEEQQNELNAIKRKQDVRGAMLAASHEELMKASAGGGPEGNTAPRTVAGAITAGGGGGGSSGPSLQEKRQAAQLMQSTETLMKFGFMSMSMTYFSSLNMVKALRTVSAQDTVMAALADVHSQRAVGFGGAPGGGMDGGAMSADPSATKAPYLSSLKPGQLPGQEETRVSAWSVEDVAKWLRTLSLGQYAEAFIDSAVDGEFLYDLNDDDLKNTLGIEHRLHRKKILNCVHRLKIAEAKLDNRLNDILSEQGLLETPNIAPDEDPKKGIPANPFATSGEGGFAGADPNEDNRMMHGPNVPISELFSYVRHAKFSLLKEAIDYWPGKPFDKILVQSPFVEGHGTVYQQSYDRLPFHANKVDDYGNTMLSHSCQNGNMKICKYLLSKGANPNHQNHNGQTPAHFAIAYRFFDLSQYLFENGADDTLENKFGLSPYDGLSIEGEPVEQFLAIEDS